MMQNCRCAIYGAGSLGTVLGAYLTQKGADVTLVNRYGGDDRPR